MNCNLKPQNWFPLYSTPVKFDEKIIYLCVNETSWIQSEHKKY